MYIGDFIKKYRQEHNMSMQNFANITGLSKAYVGMLEKIYNPKTNQPISPSIDKLNQIAKGIGITLDDLLQQLDGSQPIIIPPPKEENLKKIFSERLVIIMRERNINQNELAKILQVSESTVEKWVFKKVLPRMGLIQKMADYFNVDKNYFLEESTGYYTDPEVATLAEELRTNPNGRILFDASKDLSKQDIDIVLNLINGLKAKEGKND